jgi:hypothetical protein
VKKISAVSIGALCGLFYLINKMEYFDNIYNETYHYFKKNHDITIAFPILDKLVNILQEDVIQMVNHRLYISYYDMKKGRKVIKHTYKSNEDLIETIKRSCYVPYIIGNNMFYKARYMDGIMPYVFPRSKTKTLYIDLLHHITDMICVKQEQNNFYRMNVGLMDIHLLWLKNREGAFCKFNISNKSYLKRILRNLVENVLFTIFFLLYTLNKIKQRLVASFIQHYCV